MSGRRPHPALLLALSGTTALLALTACGVDGVDAGASASPSRGGEGGRFVVCYRVGPEPVPPPTDSACSETEPTPEKPTPTVTMTPRRDPDSGVGGPTCGPDDDEGVTRHGSPLACVPNGRHKEWDWSMSPDKGAPCVDEGEWAVPTAVLSMVCRDGRWRSEPLVTPSPTPTEDPNPTPGRGVGKVPVPPPGFTVPSAPAGR
ncbi:hypothetical protein [Streptomyces sp. NPDC059063]|uniref:hypothetical protein n=1 Tax=unclassified Streptomyces TaxID=2593676 RepID=UPI0036B3242D